MKANSLALALAFALIAPAGAFADEGRDTFLGDEFGIDEDGPDQDEMYDEDDTVYDEMDDYENKEEESE